jgi:hypothetical protein
VGGLLSLAELGTPDAACLGNRSLHPSRIYYTSVVEIEWSEFSIAIDGHFHRYWSLHHSHFDSCPEVGRMALPSLWMEIRSAEATLGESPACVRARASATGI